MQMPWEGLTRRPLSLTPLCKLVSRVGGVLLVWVFPQLKDASLFFPILLCGYPRASALSPDLRRALGKGLLGCLSGASSLASSLPGALRPACPQLLECGQGRACLGGPRAALELKACFLSLLGATFHLLFSDFVARDTIGWRPDGLRLASCPQAADEGGREGAGGCVCVWG